MDKWQERHWLPKTGSARAQMVEEIVAQLKIAASHASRRCVEACLADHEGAKSIGEVDSAITAKCLERQCRAIAKEYQ